MRHTEQDQVLQEVALVAEGAARMDAAWRAAVFADETGAMGWTPLAGFMVAELKDFVSQVAAALPATAGESERDVCMRMVFGVCECVCVCVHDLGFSVS